MRVRSATLSVAIVGAALAVYAVEPAKSAPAKPAPGLTVPTRPGTCAFTTIRRVSQRLEDGTTGRVISGSGSAVTFANKLYQVSYDQVLALNQSKRGDGVMICLVSVPKGCPPGDNRGKTYTTTNLRTEESWTLPDSSHMCGGA